MTAKENKEVAVATTPPPTVPSPMQLSRHLQPISDESAWQMANRIKNSTIIPKDFINKPENIFIAILMGREVGLSPMQAVQNIMVVNGKPCMWGDALPALAYASGLVEKFEEEIDPDGKWARCTVRRKGDTKDHVQEFTWADAVKARLTEKPGPWQTNPKRMLQMRARAFALRDKFPDALKGIGFREEIEDYDVAPEIQMPTEVIDITQKAEVFKANESQEAQPHGSGTVTGEYEESRTDSGEDPRLAKAKAKFADTYGLDSAVIDAHLAAHKKTTFGDKYPYLQNLWKELKAGHTTVLQEFGSFQLEAKKKAEGELDLE